MKKYEKAKDISPSMCIMPWIGMATDPSGGIRPCCWMEAITEDKFKGDPKDYINSDYLKEKKEQFLKGEYPESCHRCKNDDAKGMQSKRDRENQAWTAQGGNWNTLDQQEFTMIDLRLSNVCNLGCVMCGPKNSSFIFQETKKHQEKSPGHNWRQFYGVKEIDLLNPYTDDQIDEIIDIIGPNARIYCTGGEPSLVKKTTRLLEVLLEKGYNETVTLQFNSNFQVLNQKWFDLLENFKGDMLPSIDGIGKTAEYIRYPSNWKQVDDNIRSFIKQCGKTWTVKTMPTVSSASIFGLKDMYDWWYNDIRQEIPLVKETLLNNPYKAMRVQVNNRLISPKYYDIRNLPQPAKEVAKNDIDNIISEYSKYFQVPSETKYLEDIKKQIDLEPNSEFSLFIEELEKYDTIRNTNWKDSLGRLEAFTK